MDLSDLELDKLRHLAIRRDVLVVADQMVVVPTLMLETALSVLAVGSPRLRAESAESIQSLAAYDPDGKLGYAFARFEAFLPLLDLAYFDLVVYVAGRGWQDDVSPGAGPEAAGEFLQLAGFGCRPDAWLAVLTDEAALAAWVIGRAGKMRRAVEMVDRLAVLAPIGRRTRVAEAA